MSEKRTVLVAVDGSDNSDNAFDWYLEKMMKDNDYLCFVHVTEPPSLPVFSFKSGISAPTEKWEEILKKQIQEVSKIEGMCVCRAQAKKMKYEFLHIDNESPGPGIVEAAKNKNADLIIIGTRGQNKLRRTILGSVSDYVLHHSRLPVAIVPLKDADQN